MEDSLKDSAKNQIELLLGLLNSKLENCKERFKSEIFSSKFDSEINTIVNVYIIRSLTNISRYALFLVTNVSRKQDESQFYLSQLRTLTEIVVKLIYILSLEVTDSARILICEDLVAMHKIADENFSDYIAHTLSSYEKLMIELDYLPRTFEDFSKNGLKKIQKTRRISLFYPDFNNLISEDFIKRNTPLLQKYMTGNLREIFEYNWKSASEHVHGNHFFNHASGNEIFWIDLSIFVLLGTVLEIVDRQVLGNERSADLRIRFKESMPIGAQLKEGWLLKLRR